MPLMEPLAIPPLGLSEREAEIEFERLQAKLIPLWKSIASLDGPSHDPQTIVVVPNGQISEKTITNFMRPTEVSRFELFFLVDQDVPSDHVINVIKAGVAAVIGKENNGPLAEPKFKVRIDHPTPDGLLYSVRYFIVPREVSPAKARHTITAEGDIDLLVCDYVLEGEDGGALLEDLRSQGGTIPCIFISGYPEYSLDHLQQDGHILSACCQCASSHPAVFSAAQTVCSDVLSQASEIPESSYPDNSCSRVSFR